MSTDFPQLSAELTDTGLSAVAAVIDQAQMTILALLAICESRELSAQERQAVDAAREFVGSSQS